MTFKFYGSMVKGLKLDFRRFFGIITTFDAFKKVTEENLVGGRGRLFVPSSILKRVNNLHCSGIIKKIFQVGEGRGMHTTTTQLFAHSKCHIATYNT